MAIKSVAEKMGLRTAGQNQLYQRVYGRVFLVQTTSSLTGSAAVRLATDPVDPTKFVPRVGNSYTTLNFGGSEHDLGSFVQTVDVREDSEDGLQWLVTVNYGPYDTSTFSENPIDWLPRLSNGQQKFERTCSEDKDGNAIVNKAGDPYADPVTADALRSLIVVKRNELCSVYDLTLAERMTDALNNATWNGFAALTVKCESITTGDSIYDSNNQVYYWEVTYVFAIDRDTWKKTILERGFSELDTGSPPKQKQILDSGGQPLSEASLLDSSGHHLASTGTPVFTDWYVYEETDYTVFNLNFDAVLGRA